MKKTTLLLLFLALCLAFSPTQIFAGSTENAVTVSVEGIYIPGNESDSPIKSVTFKKKKIIVKGRVTVSTFTSSEYTSKSRKNYTFKINKKIKYVYKYKNLKTKRLSKRKFIKEMKKAKKTSRYYYLTFTKTDGKLVEICLAEL